MYTYQNSDTGIKSKSKLHVDQTSVAISSVMEQALEYFEQLRRINVVDGQKDACISETYKRIIPRWHFAMLNDHERNSAFETAIKKLNLELDSKLVLDVGTGTGLLAMLAARYGAKRVVSCEMVRPIAMLANQIVALNGFQDVVEIISKKSNEVVVGNELPRKADVLVTETVDCGLIGEGIVPIIRHAREHLLVSNPSIVPGKAKIKFSLLESSTIHGLNHVTEASTFNVSLFNEFSTSGYFPVRLNTWPYSLLSGYNTAIEFDFLNDSLLPQQRQVPVRVDQDGTCHGIVFWFELDLGHDIQLINDPKNQKSHWMQAVQCFKEPIEVYQDDLIELLILQEDTSIEFQLNKLFRAN
jgi:predicted RNA methylase